jgi:hypothetical protein
LGVDLARLAPAALNPVTIGQSEYALQGLGVLLRLAHSGGLVGEEVVVELDDLALGRRVGVEYFEGGFVGDLADVRVVAAEDVVNARGVRLFLKRLASRLDDVLHLRQSLRVGVSDQLPRSHQFLTQDLFPLFLLNGRLATSFMELLSRRASRCLKCSQLKS